MARSVMLCVVVFLALMLVGTTRAYSGDMEDGNQPPGPFNDPVAEFLRSAGQAAQYPDAERQDKFRKRDCWASNPALCSGSFGKRRVRSTAV